MFPDKELMGFVFLFVLVKFRGKKIKHKYLNKKQSKTDCQKTMEPCLEGFKKNV